MRLLGLWFSGGEGVEEGRVGDMEASTGSYCTSQKETQSPGKLNDLFRGGQGAEIKSPAKIRNSGAHSTPLLSCHTSLYFIAFVQHPIVPLPFVPYSEPWLFITQPALLFSFLLFEVPERKVLFSAV